MFEEEKGTDIVIAGVMMIISCQESHQGIRKSHCETVRHEETNAWLSFFGGRKHQNPNLTIEGNLVFNGVPANQWKADELHQLRCFVQLRDADVWGTLTAFQVRGCARCIVKVVGWLLVRCGGLFCKPRWFNDVQCVS